jgi:biopolymer transport protein ExbD
MTILRSRISVFYIRADADLPYRNVVRTMNQLQNVGFTKIGLVAEDRR